MKIALAQINSYKGNLAENIRHHQKWIEEAAAQGADLVVFPELSLTGYEPSLANKLALPHNDPSLEIFQVLSNAHNISIGVGLPTKGEMGILISLIFFLPQAIRRLYSKQHLHLDELPFFVPGEEQLVLQLHGFRIAPAICYESLLTEHVEMVSGMGADIYLAPVAKSEQGISKGYKHYPTIAQKYGLWVLMVNCIWPCDDFVAYGKTAAWNREGELIGEMDDLREGILLIDTEVG